MPPKPKFTKEEIIKAALDIVSEKGIEGLTARELGSVLGSSARPVFTIFKNMEEVNKEVRKAAMIKFENCAGDGFSDMPVFKQIGMKMVLFGIREPKLYQLLFMQENKKLNSFDELFLELGIMADVCIEAIKKDYDLSIEEAKILFQNVWIYTYGIGVLCATKVCSFSEQQIGKMLTTEFTSIMMFIKAGKNK